MFEPLEAERLSRCVRVRPSCHWRRVKPPASKNVFRERGPTVKWATGHAGEDTWPPAGRFIHVSLASHSSSNGWTNACAGSPSSVAGVFFETQCVIRPPSDRAPSPPRPSLPFHSGKEHVRELFQRDSRLVSARMPGLAADLTPPFLEIGRRTLHLCSNKFGNSLTPGNAYLRLQSPSPGGAQA